MQHISPGGFKTFEVYHPPALLPEADMWSQIRISLRQSQEVRLCMKHR